MTIHKLLPACAAFLAPVKFADTLYYGMSVDVSRKAAELNSPQDVTVDIKSKERYTSHVIIF